jgi:hypothetical protein
MSAEIPIVFVVDDDRSVRDALRRLITSVGMTVEVPGHFAQRTPDGQIVEPPMTIPSPNGGLPVFLQGGAQP